MAETESLDSIWERVGQASSIDELTAQLREVNDLESAEKLTPEQSAQALRYALTTLADLTLEDPRTAYLLIEEFLLPACLRVTGKGDTNYAIATGRLRKLLRKWLEQYTESDGESVRTNVLDRLCTILQQEPTKECLWTVGSIGYRIDLVSAKLWPLAFRDDAIGDTAPGTIVNLGMSPETRNAVVELLKQKIAAVGLRTGLLYTIQETAGSETVDLILDNIAEPGTNAAKPLSTPFSLLVNSLTKAAAAIPENVDLQKRVWATIREHRQEATRSGELAARCNIEDTVVDYVRWIADDSDEGDPTTRRYIYYDRLSELIRPRALSGWKLVERDTLLPIVKADAIHDTKLTGHYVTTNVRLKEAAFETALCLGTADLIDWLESAVGEETSGHVKGSVLNLAACLHLEELPVSVLELISTERNLERTDGTDEFVLRTGAIQLAQSAGTRQAFEALLGFGFTYEGQPQRSTSEALADVARERLEAGDGDIVQALLGNALNHVAAKRHRDVAIDSLCYLATCGWVKENVTDELLRLMNDGSLDEFSRCKAIETLGFLNTETTKSAVPVLVELSSTESDLGWRAIEALTRHGLFERHADLLCNRLSLRRSALGWSLVHDEQIVGWQAFLVGLLYQRDRDGFANAVSQVLDRANADTVFQVLESAAHHGESTPSIVLDALVNRIYKRFTIGTVEMALFDMLAAISPQRLADEMWDRKWKDWLPEGRVALCNALGGAALSDNALGRAIALLTELAFDGVYAVRRAAYRAMASLDVEALISTCAIWAQSSLVRLRKCAAEAAAWIPIEVCTNVDDWGLSFDVERSVREIAASIASDRWVRHWERQYLKIILDVKHPGNEELLDAYRYGRALARIGDDATINRLKRHLANSSLPSHVSHWIRRLIKATEGRWNKVSRNWPKPSFNWSGVVEEVDGNIVLDGKVLPSHFSLCA